MTVFQLRQKWNALFLQRMRVPSKPLSHVDEVGLLAGMFVLVITIHFTLEYFYTCLLSVLYKTTYDIFAVQLFFIHSSLQFFFYLHFDLALSEIINLIFLSLH